jgi:nicotinamidase-related amidase
MTNSLLIDSSKSALLVMDYQIDVLEKFMAPADSGEVLSVLPKLLAAARSADMLVIYVVVSFRPGYPEISPRNPTFSVIAQNGLLRVGSPGTQIHPAVAPIEGEPVVIKHRVSAFGGTDLQTILQSRAIESGDVGLGWRRSACGCGRRSLLRELPCRRTPGRRHPQRSPRGRAPLCP